MNKIILSIALISVVFISQAQVVKLAGPRVGATIVTAGSAADFIVSGRRMPIWICSVTLMATWFGGGTVMGACLNGRSDNVIKYHERTWSLSGAEPRMCQHEADLLTYPFALPENTAWGRNS